MKAPERLNIFTPCSTVSIANFEHVLASWEVQAQCILSKILEDLNFFTSIIPPKKSEKYDLFTW